MKNKYFYMFLLVSSSYADKATVVTNDPTCTVIGESIFLNGGNYIDAAISAVLCESVVKPQDTGIGGGFVGVLKSKKGVYMINSRETTPYKLKSQSDIKKKKYGSIGTPGMLKGLEVLHKKLGHSTWQSILSPVISICELGLPSVNLSAYLAKKYGYKQLFKNPKKYYNKPLCNTLRKVQKYGADYFYNTSSSKILKELGDNSYLSKKDFLDYKAKFQLPSMTKIRDSLVYSTSYPGPGKQLLTSIKSMIMGNDTLFSGMDKFYKNNYDYRYKKYVGTKKKKRNDLRRNHGTSNICTKKGNEGICITSTINQYFGSGFYSNSTGVFMNNQLDDLPHYYENITSIVTPPTSASITLVVDNNTPILLIGGTGGDRIPSGVLSVIYYMSRYNISLEMALRIPRVYYYNHYLAVESCHRIWRCENSYLEDTLRYSNLHTARYYEDYRYYNTVTGILDNKGCFDPRRGGLGSTVTL